MAATAGGAAPREKLPQKGDAGVMGGADRPPPTPPHTPQTPDPATGRGRGARLSLYAPAPAPSGSGPRWVGGAGLAGPGGQRGPKPEAGMLRRGRRTGGRPRSSGREGGGG